jgi:hypothetical protein
MESGEMKVPTCITLLVMYRRTFGCSRMCVTRPKRESPFYLCSPGGILLVKCPLCQLSIIWLR